MFKEKIDNLVPREKLINLEQAANYCKERKVNFSKRTIRYYITEKLLPKPMYVKKIAYYDKDFIVDELEAIYVLRTLFNRGIRDIKTLARNPSVNLKEIVSELHDILDQKISKLFPKHKDRPLGLRYVNNRFMQYFAEEYFKIVGKGLLPSKMNSQKFISYVFDHYEQDYKG